ncbi:hypothetical protein [Luteimonas sp. MC1828]|uniref:hypothetical protein n=1 Tax=Luteimonas sp. MC1828 TaxID=2799787 RepID=UPI0018F16D6F|nr:hypothetical protein [Luteimonas sp. MC1828]MBJ7573811.1 hypothetical protein [Luteimonas sp. MC1828]
MEGSLGGWASIVSIAAGLLAIAGSLAGRGYWRRRTSRGAAESSQGGSNNSQSVVVNVGAPSATDDTSESRDAIRTMTVPELKRAIRILFIDDDRGFKIVGILKKMGWEYVRIVTDVSSLEQSAITEADVIFVDIQGVGKKMHYADEGLGLALAIKRRHQNKKVIIYSAQEVGARFHEALQEADYSLPKTAEPVRFEDTIVRVLQK